MTPLLVTVTIILTVALAVLGAITERGRRQRARTMRTSSRRILFPFAGEALSRRGLDAALRLARADQAALVPVFLARVAMHLPLDTPLPRQCGAGLALLEAIEQRAIALGVPVDARIDRGRTYRHALREAISNERFDRVVVSAAGHGAQGFHGDDIAWLLDNAPGEVVIVRPDGDDKMDGRRGSRLPPWRHRRTGADVPEIERSSPVAA